MRFMLGLALGLSAGVATSVIEVKPEKVQESYAQLSTPLSWGDWAAQAKNVLYTANYTACMTDDSIWLDPELSSPAPAAPRTEPTTSPSSPGSPEPAATEWAAR